MRIVIQHQLTARFDPSANHALAHLLVRPRDTAHQRIVDWQVATNALEPGTFFADCFGNQAELVTFAGPVEEVRVSISGTVETSEDDGVVGRLSDDPVPVLFTRVTASTRSPVVVHGKFRNVDVDGPERLTVLHELMERVHTMRDVSAEADAETPTCTDSVHSFIGAARALGIPARFVTGYLAEDGEFVDAGPHVWAETWDNGLGWVGFDPVNNLCPTTVYVRVAVGFDEETTPRMRLHPAPLETQSALESVQIAVAAQG